VKELRMAVLKGGKHKAPGPDGISSEFFKQHFDIIQDDLLGVVNDMFLNPKVTTAQKIGTLVCIPKHSKPMTPDDFRPITLFNTDYKIVAHIIANKLKPIMEEMLADFQYCGVPQNNIPDAVNTIRDTIAHAEMTGTPLCILSLDFQQAFDRVAHQYL
jgi:hypothetical protein